jgi:hypothetical protein
VKKSRDEEGDQRPELKQIPDLRADDPCAEQRFNDG